MVAVTFDDVRYLHEDFPVVIVQSKKRLWIGSGEKTGSYSIIHSGYTV